MNHASPFVDWPRGEVLVLASVSPRRAQLLDTAGIPHRVVPAADVESGLAPGLARDIAEGRCDPAGYAEALAAAKADDVAARHPGDLVLGADTIVILDGEILEKPRDEADARRILGRLAGNTHTVITAISLRRLRTGTAWTGSESTEVEFLPLGGEAIARYVATGEPMDKAGAYGIQGFGAMMIAGVRGCYFNVMGLPLARLGAALRQVLADRPEG